MVQTFECNILQKYIFPFNFLFVFTCTWPPLIFIVIIIITAVVNYYNCQRTDC